MRPPYRRVIWRLRLDVGGRRFLRVLRVCRSNRPRARTIGMRHRRALGSVQRVLSRECRYAADLPIHVALLRPCESALGLQ